MKLSLITVCYNSASVLRGAMESVLGQAYDDIEYIVVDGQSTDGTVEKVREFFSSEVQKCTASTNNLTDARPSTLHTFNLPHLTVHLISEPDEGMYDALNKGIKMATGDVVGILNADDFFRHTNVLKEVAEAFDDSTDAVYGDIRFVKNDDFDAVIRYYSAKRWKPWMLRWGYMPPHPTFYCRREYFEKLGGYKLGYKIGADYELLIRFLWKGGLRSKYINDAMVDMRLGGLSTGGLSSTLTLNREVVRANRENGIYTNLPMLCIKYFFKIWEFVFKGQRSCRT